MRLDRDHQSSLFELRRGKSTSATVDSHGGLAPPDRPSFPLARGGQL